MPEFLYWLTSAVLLACVVLLVFHRSIGRWTAAINAASDRLASEEWDDATWWEALTGRRKGRHDDEASDG